MGFEVESGIRGGISTITKRHAAANNRYMTDHDHNKEKVYILYLDANNLYGWAMSQPLPTGEFEWMREEEPTNWRDISCFLEANIRYPVKLHDLHNEYPLAPERITINKVEKLIPNLNDKENYVLHSRNLTFYIENGLVLTGVRRGIKFEESS